MKSLALLLLLAPLAAHARGEIRAGGTSLVCFHEAATATSVRAEGLLDKFLAPELVESIEALDLYEARLSSRLDGRGAEVLPVDETAEARDPWSYSKRIEARLTPYFPVLTALMADARTRLRHPTGAEAIDYARTPFGLVLDLDDADLFDSGHCVLATTVATGHDESRNYLRIDERLYRHEKNSTLSRAVLRLHELLHMAARTPENPVTSATTRTLITVLAGREGTLTVGRVSRMIQQLGFHRSDAHEPAPLRLLGTTWTTMVEEAEKTLKDMALSPRKRASRLGKLLPALRQQAHAQLANLGYAPVPFQEALLKDLELHEDNLRETVKMKDIARASETVARLKGAGRLEVTSRHGADPRLLELTIPGWER